MGFGQTGGALAGTQFHTSDVFMDGMRERG
jgi:hypothetical protein